MAPQRVLYESHGVTIAHPQRSIFRGFQRQKNSFHPAISDNLVYVVALDSLLVGVFALAFL